MKNSVIFRAAFAALALLFVASCGGGGGSSSSPAPTANTSTPPPTASTAPDDPTGVVGIIIKDAPSDEYTRIMLRITSVELLGDGDPQVVFEGDLEFDLLSLRNHANLLALSDEVAVGDYEKIRLRVTSITLYCEDADGDGFEESVDVRVPANGKIDLNPRGTFTVAADSALLIQIDLDAKKSIHIVGTGNGSYRFRPVVFVDIDERQIPQGLIRVSGMVGQISDDPSYFELCRLDDVHIDSLTDGCIQVNTNDATAFFDADGQPIGFGDLVQGQTVTVFAEAIVVPIEEGDDDDDVSIDNDTIRMVQLHAFVVHQGEPANLLSLDGTAADAVTDEGRFNFQVAAGQEIPEELISVLLQRNTRILSGEDLSDLEATAILRGVMAEVSGVLLPSIPEDPSNLSAALIVIEGPAPEEGALTELEGEVIRIDAETFTVLTDNEEPPMERCVAPLDNARYLTVMDSSEGADHTEVEPDYLAEGQIVSVFGGYGEGDCFEADTIIIDETDTEEE
jgi:hypothetical protein